MLTASTTKLDLIETSQEGNPEHRVDVEFPINIHTGSADSAVVYFEIPPGYRLATHTDSEEEVLYIVQGEGEAEVGDERGHVSAGDLAVIPAMVPHGVRNTGEERLKVVGFFSGAKIVSEFTEPLQPVGAAVLEMGAPPPALASA
ncbi:MAG TPA: cupin domain-containing protein [Thermoleophilaceae bacterium]|jgi:mannose-6-phosphate isomerase-like protein (cupin superfamily)|nr:cupin domain-containing protein [Thermoleophilaceae bacterium]